MLIRPRSTVPISIRRVFQFFHVKNRLQLIAVAIAAIAFSPFALSAQEAPGDVTIKPDGATAVITWTASPTEGVTYRILRGTEGRLTDITRPVAGTTFTDKTPTAGTTYFYQVIAVFRDGATAAAEPVEYTMPAAPPPTTVTAVAEPSMNTVTAGGTQTTVIAPVVSGVTVTGTTTASATISWQSLQGATSYAISGGTPVSGLSSSATSWTDTKNGMGFITAGVYTFTVTASLANGTTATGQATWTRPNPTCIVPANQPMQPLLDPTRALAWSGPWPSGGAFTMNRGDVKPPGVIAYLVERSAPGTNTWTMLGSTCKGSLNLGVGDPGFVDRDLVTHPGSPYLYRVTAFAANGEIGAMTMPFTVPNLPTLKWLEASNSAGTVTLRFRYEPPAASPPRLPTSYYIVSEYGLNQLVRFDEYYCAGLTGCAVTLTGAPPGSHSYSVRAEWGFAPVGLLSKVVSAEAPVVVRPYK